MDCGASLIFAYSQDGRRWIYYVFLSDMLSFKLCLHISFFFQPNVFFQYLFKNSFLVENHKLLTYITLLDISLFVLYYLLLYSCSRVVLIMAILCILAPQFYVLFNERSSRYCPVPLLQLLATSISFTFIMIGKC